MRANHLAAAPANADWPVKTTAQLAASDTLRALSSLLEAFGDHAEFGPNRDEGLVQWRYGAAYISTGPGTVLVTAEADDEIRLSYVKMAVAELSDISAHETKLA